MKFKVSVFIIAALFLFFGGTSLFAGVTGKIAGKVTDAATGEGLIGTSIMIEGTNMGNMAGPDGSYFILNVPPGTYNIKASLIGYQSMTITTVRIIVDVTTEVNFKLNASAVEVEGIVVTGERPAIEKTITSNLRNIGSEQIQSMPVKQMEEVLNAQVGFVTRNQEMHVRGGRAGEVQYIVDGVETRDLLGGLGLVKPGMDVTSASVEEIQILKGGFDAEYGNVQSAAVNIVTKEGSPKLTQGHMEFLTDDFGSSSLNKSSFNGDRLEMNLSGPEPLLTQYLLPIFGIKFTGDKLTYFLGGDVYKTNTYMDVNKFATSKTQKRFRIDNFLGLDIPERMRNSYTTTLKLAYKAAPDKKLIFSYKGTWDRYTLFFDPTSETRGDISVWTYRYTPSTLPQFVDKSSLFRLAFTHNVSKSSFYEVNLSQYSNDLLMAPGDPYNPGGYLTPGDFIFYTDWEEYTDVNKNGKWDSAEPYIDLNGNEKYDMGEPFSDVNTGKNGLWDPGEPFLDGDGDGIYNPSGGRDYFIPQLHDMDSKGRWNNAEIFKDTDSNGVLDPKRMRQAYGTAGVDEGEPYWDGDIILGEPFTDVNTDGIYEDTIDRFQDLSGNGIYDGPTTLPSAWNYQDINRNGRYDPGEPCVPFQDLNGNGIYDRPNSQWDPGEPYADKNGNARWDYVDGFYDRGYERRVYYSNRKSTVLSLKFDFTTQMTKEHQVKTGLQIERDKLHLTDIRYPYYVYDGMPDGGPWPDHGIFRDYYTRRPVRGAYYVQDKIEYGAMIAKLGFRYDFFIQSADVRAIATDSSENPTQTAIQSTRSKFSPRLGVSYPITDKAKVYFNYGYFYQLPELRYMYARTTQGTTALKVYGNYNLDYQKLIQYEIGVQYAMTEDYKLDIAGFYKDYYGQLNTDQMRKGGQTWEVYENLDYARARGIEVQLDKRPVGYISGYLNYQYAFAYGKSSAEVSNYYARFEEGDIPIQEFPLDWDVRHQITLSLDLRVGPKDRPKIFGIKVPESWGVNVLWKYSSGFPFSPDQSLPGIHLAGRTAKPLTNSKRMPANSNVDLRFYKDLRIWKLDYSFIVWVNNLFDKKNIYDVYGSTGRPTTAQNELNSEIEGPVILPGREIDQNPVYYGPGRNIRMGVSFNF